MKTTTKHVLILFPFAPNKFKRFAEVCRRNGWKTTCAVAKGHLFEASDDVKFVEFDSITEDVAEVQGVLEKFGPYDVVVPFSEFSVVLAETLSQALGLSLNQVPDPRSLRDKQKMRQVLFASGCNQPEILQIVEPSDPLDEAQWENLPFPVIVKPSDAAGSLNVRICDNSREVSLAVASVRNFVRWDDVKMSFGGVALIEEFALGNEYSTEAVVQDRKIVFRNHTLKFVSDAPYRDEIGHVLPILHTEPDLVAVEKLLLGIVNGFGYHNGVLHVEYKIHENQGPCVIEVAFRVPGDRIADLVEMKHGISLEESHIRVRLGAPWCPQSGFHTSPTLTKKYLAVKFQFAGKAAAGPVLDADVISSSAKWMAMSQLSVASNTTSLPQRLGFSILASDSLSSLSGWVSEKIKVEKINAESTWALRHKVLRPHQDLADCIYPLDHNTSSLHIGLFLNDTLVGIGSAFPESKDGSKAEGHYRLRGMAVLEEHRGRRLGSLILQAITHELASVTAVEIWCNARSTALEFYKREGFESIGDEFILGNLGPHMLLKRPLGNEK